MFKSFWTFNDNIYKNIKIFSRALYLSKEVKRAREILFHNI